MKLQRMRYALAIADHQHFGRAAAALHVRQPALSQQIKQLESELGVKLFERGLRGVELTTAGEAFCREARRAVDAAERAETAARRAEEGAMGRLRVGYIGTAMYWLLPRVVQEFRTRYPEVDLDFVELASSRQAEQLADGRLDFGLLRVPLPDRWPTLRFRRLAREPLAVALPAQHPLTRRGSVPVARLCDVPLVVVRRSLEPASHDQILRLCRQEGFEPRIAAEADQIESVLGLVAAGLGAALGPSSLQNLQRPDVTYRLLAPRVDIPDLALCRDATELSPVQRNFDAILRDVTGTCLRHHEGARRPDTGSGTEGNGTGGARKGQGGP